MLLNAFFTFYHTMISLKKRKDRARSLNMINAASSFEMILTDHFLKISGSSLLQEGRQG